MTPLGKVEKARRALEADIDRLAILSADVARADEREAWKLARRIIVAISYARTALLDVLQTE